MQLEHNGESITVCDDCQQPSVDHICDECLGDWHSFGDDNGYCDE